MPRTTPERRGCVPYSSNASRNGVRESSGTFLVRCTSFLLVYPDAPDPQTKPGILFEPIQRADCHPGYGLVSVL